jgi:hypothetical protein
VQATWHLAADPPLATNIGQLAGVVSGRVLHLAQCLAGSTDSGASECGRSGGGHAATRQGAAAGGPLLGDASRSTINANHRADSVTGAATLPSSFFEGWRQRVDELLSWMAGPGNGEGQKGGSSQGPGQHTAASQGSHVATLVVPHDFCWQLEPPGDLGEGGESGSAPAILDLAEALMAVPPPPGQNPPPAALQPHGAAAQRLPASKAQAVYHQLQAAGQISTAVGTECLFRASAGEDGCAVLQGSYVETGSHGQPEPTEAPPVTPPPAALASFARQCAAAIATVIKAPRQPLPTGAVGVSVLAPRATSHGAQAPQRVALYLGGEALLLKGGALAAAARIQAAASQLAMPGEVLLGSDKKPASHPCSAAAISPVVLLCENAFARADRGAGCPHLRRLPYFPQEAARRVRPWWNRPRWCTPLA